MYLLYVDESGSVADAAQDYFVLAGVAVHERATHWIEQELNGIAARFNAGNPHAVELHGSPMRGGRSEWRAFPQADRMKAMKDALGQGLSGVRRQPCTLFGAVVKKSALPGVDPVEHAFEHLSSRFDLFLRRRYMKFNDPQRGLMIFDESSTEARIQNLAREFKYTRRRAEKTKNYAEVPVFLDSRASRLIQLADLVAFAMYRNFAYADTELFDIIKDRFDTEGGVNHGLYVMEDAPLIVTETVVTEQVVLMRSDQSRAP